VVALLVLAGMALGMSIAWADIMVGLYLEIPTYEWTAWAPGPTGVAQKDSNTMFVVDGDRNNYPEWEDDGINLWEISLTGAVLRTGVLSFREPTGVDYHPASGTLYVSSDSAGGVYAITAGTDTLFGTADDVEDFIGIPGSDDVEDPVFDPFSGDLFVLNGGSNGRIYRIDLPSQAVLPNPIDISGLGSDWEGLAMTPAGELLAGNNLGQEIHVLDTSGNPLQVIDVSNIGLARISGLGVSAPGAGGDGYDIWIADRQETCNCDEPANIDGRLWRLTTDGTPPPVTTTTTAATTTTSTGATTTTTTLPGSTTTTLPGTTTTLPGTTTTTTTPLPPPPVPQTAESAVLQADAGFWRLYRGQTQVAGFYFGNPGDYGFMGDWDCDGIDTPGLYRRSDGYVYLRNSNTQGTADVAFFFGNPGDLPLAGDFDGNGCDTVSIYRPAEGKFYIMNHLGVGDAGLGAAAYAYYFGNPGDAPFMGDWNGDGIDTPGLRRNSDGFVYLRHSNSQGPGEIAYFYGDSGDVVFTGDWDQDGDDTLGLYRPSNGTVYLRNTNTTGAADTTVLVGGGMQPAGGNF